VSEYRGREYDLGFDHGFKEIGGDTCTGAVDVTVVENGTTADAFGLDASIFFGPNTTSGGVKALHAKENDEPDAFDVFLKSGAYESTGVLTEVSMTWRLGEEEQLEGHLPTMVAKALERLEWY
jgi:hypothetical protein